MSVLILRSLQCIFLVFYSKFATKLKEIILEYNLFTGSLKQFVPKST